MKTVSYTIAKAIKDAGYQQGKTDCVYVTQDIDDFDEGELVDKFYTLWVEDNVIDAPYAMEVWVWLETEKKIIIQPNSTYINDSDIKYATTTHFIESNTSIGNDFIYNSSEEAIIATIEYLVENNLIK